MGSRLMKKILSSDSFAIQFYLEIGGDMADKYEVGDVIRMKKKHPCGSNEWEILRVGADFRLKCKGCGHQIMVTRVLVEKNTREIKKRLEKEKET